MRRPPHMTRFSTASVGVGWWLGELALFALRHEPEVLPLAAVLYLLLLSGPGYVLWSRRDDQGR